MWFHFIYFCAGHLDSSFSIKWLTLIQSSESLPAMDGLVSVEFLPVSNLAISP
jgi:hypothetical protein